MIELVAQYVSQEHTRRLMGRRVYPVMLGAIPAAVVPRNVICVLLGHMRVLVECKRAHHVLKVISPRLLVYLESLVVCIVPPVATLVPIVLELWAVLLVLLEPTLTS